MQHLSARVPEGVGRGAFSTGVIVMTGPTEFILDFVQNIGGPLRSGARHDGRAPDYDDWSLNGDILFWYPLLDRAFEISSMGIRVDAASLAAQLAASGCGKRAHMEFHQGVLHDVLPLSIGGGIGQSRLCMFFLDKAHIGEVQSSVWPEAMAGRCAELGMRLL